MRKQIVSLQTLIRENRKEILSNKEEIARIEKQIDEKHVKQMQTNQA